MGSLHETNRSLWVATTEAGEFPPLAGDARPDVVVGAGITGLTTARLLVEDDASVVVIDAGVRLRRRQRLHHREGSPRCTGSPTPTWPTASTATASTARPSSHRRDRPPRRARGH